MRAHLHLVVLGLVDARPLCCIVRSSSHHRHSINVYGNSKGCTLESAAKRGARCEASIRGPAKRSQPNTLSGTIGSSRESIDYGNICYVF